MDRDSRSSRLHRYCAVALIVAWSFAQTGCNLFGRLDPPGDRQDKYAAALAMANSGDCKGAKELLESVLPPDDDIASALGWAYMCLAGATAANIASSLYSFSGSSTNKTVVGALANTMLPMDSEKAVNAQKASEAFAQISDFRRRNLSVGIGKFVQAAAVLANQALNASSSVLEKTDISNSACANFNGNCTASAGTCTAGMSNADVDSFITFVSAAATALGSVGSSTDLSRLATLIQAGLQAGDPGRCFIFNETIP